MINPRDLLKLPNDCESFCSELADCHFFHFLGPNNKSQTHSDVKVAKQQTPPKEGNEVTQQGSAIYTHNGRVLAVPH